MNIDFCIEIVRIARDHAFDEDNKIDARSVLDDFYNARDTLDKIEQIPDNLRMFINYEKVRTANVDLEEKTMTLCTLAKALVVAEIEGKKASEFYSDPNWK